MFYVLCPEGCYSIKLSIYLRPQLCTEPLWLYIGTSHHTCRVNRPNRNPLAYNSWRSFGLFRLVYPAMDTDISGVSRIPLEEIRAAHILVKEKILRTPLVPLNYDLPTEDGGASPPKVESCTLLNRPTNCVAVPHTLRDGVGTFNINPYRLLIIHPESVVLETPVKPSIGCRTGSQGLVWQKIQESLISD